MLSSSARTVAARPALCKPPLGGLAAASRPLEQVIVLDDDISVREALQALLGTVGLAAETFASASAFLNARVGTGPSCLILDVGLPDLNGLELQMHVAREQPHTPIIFITGNGSIPMSVRAMKAGAMEFLTKPFDDQKLLDAVESALLQSRNAIAEDAVIEDLTSRFRTLSGREQQVFSLAVSGLLNKQIAGDLGISEITVKAHRGRVMEKMKAKSFADLVRISQKLGIAPADTRRVSDLGIVDT
jgi:FixJ family two-component response regulator